MTEAVDHVKTELMPDFDFDAFNHDEVDSGMHENGETIVAEIAATVETPPPVTNTAAATEDVDKW